MTFLPPERYRADLVAALGLFALQLLVVLWVRSTGFHAVSDDDYARVVIAQRFVENPTWDPSGTSWLPFPFLHTGVMMKLFSASLEVARAWALVSACAGTLLLYAASRTWGTSATLSFAAATACALLPTSAFLSVSTVPEYLTGALVVYGVTSLTRRSTEGSGALFGGLCLFLACASRYETWPAACAASAILVFRFLGGARSVVSLGAAGLCLLFPVVWLLHGVINHKDAFFFVARVTDYKNALGDSSLPLEAALLYLRALFLAEPEVSCALFATFIFALFQKEKRATSRLFLPWIPLGAMFVVLVLGALTSGAPTHHEERALLSIWLLAALTAAYLLDENRRALPRVLTVLVIGIVIGSGLRAFGVFERQPFTDRAAEERLGRRLAELTSGAEKIGLALSDYGYFAVMAAGENPGRFTILETHDPRETKNASASLLKRYEDTGGCLFVTTSEAPLTSRQRELESIERWSLRQISPCKENAAQRDARP